MVRRLLLAGIVGLAAAACAACGGTPTAPTPTAPPAPVAAPPPPPPPPYTGVWEGQYRIDRCDGTGSMQDLLCSSQRGLYPPGTRLPIRLDLTQSGATVSGRIELGNLTGIVNGVVRSNGLLTLSGTARSGTFAAEITYWDTVAIGNTMEGYFTFNATVVNVPGVAVVVTTLQGVTRR